MATSSPTEMSVPRETSQRRETGELSHVREAHGVMARSVAFNKQKIIKREGGVKTELSHKETRRKKSCGPGLNM